MKSTKNILVSAAIAGTLILQVMSGHAQGVALTENNAAEPVRSFRVHIPNERLVDLRKRILATQWEQPQLFARELRAAFKSLR
jgi:hypothetical protein